MQCTDTCKDQKIRDSSCFLQGPAGLPAHTRALILKDNSEVRVVIMIRKLGALPTKCPTDTADLRVHYLISRFQRGTETFQSDAFPQWRPWPGQPTSAQKRGDEAAVWRGGPWEQTAV